MQKSSKQKLVELVDISILSIQKLGCTFSNIHVTGGTWGGWWGDGHGGLWQVGLCRPTVAYRSRDAWSMEFGPGDFSQGFFIGIWWGYGICRDKINMEIWGYDGYDGVYPMVRLVTFREFSTPFPHMFPYFPIVSHENQKLFYMSQYCPIVSLHFPIKSMAFSQVFG